MLREGGSVNFEAGFIESFGVGGRGSPTSRLMRARVLCFAGAKQLFWGDVHAETKHFQPLFSFLATDIVFVENRRRLNQLPRQSKGGILSVVATFIPFYTNVMVRLHLPRP